jgi:radical SAM superfamily enzyme YgiQ (UPF0313 family)
MAEVKAPTKVVLVNPPFQYFPGVKKGADSYTRPPLGIAYLAAYLQKAARPTPEVSLLDCEAEGFGSEAVAARAILQREPDVVGFSVVTGTYHASSRLAQAIKRARPETQIVVGGPHITALPNEAMPGVDAKVIGEGEATLADYLAALQAGARPEIAGLAWLRDGEVESTGPARAVFENLDDVPIPARELLGIGRYFHSFPYPGARNFTTLFTSRGCPFDCNFCGNEILWGRRVRYHSLERTYAEIDEVVRQGSTLVFFDDDTFTANRARALKICDFVARRHPALRWICHARADTVDRELLGAMKRAGCVEVQIGAESGDPEVLRRTDKALTVEQVERAFAWTREAGLNSWATFILGNDGETPATIGRTMALAKKIDPTYASFIVLLPFPGTRIFGKYRAAGFINTRDWEMFSWHGQPVIDLPGLSPDDLAAWRRRAYLGFYLRPGKLMRTAWHVLRSASWREMLRNFRAWRVLVR